MPHIDRGCQNASTQVTHLFLTGSKLAAHTAEWLPSLPEIYLTISCHIFTDISTLSPAFADSLNHRIYALILCAGYEAEGR
jgi:hypothetical protein